MIKQVSIKELRLNGFLKGLDNPRKQHWLSCVAVLAASRSLVESIKQSLLREVPKANQKNPKYSDTLLDAVRFSKNDKTTGVRVVHAYGVRDSGSGTYRTRFFNEQTKDRYQKTYKGEKLKKKRYLGHVGGTMFFEKGYEAGKAKAMEAMKTAVTNLLQRLDE